jgi:acyl-CoA thioesterase
MHLPAPDVPQPEIAQSYFRKPGAGPTFAQNFDILLAGGNPPMSGAAEADVSIWMRHKDPRTPADAVTLLALADAPPPAAMSMFTAPGRISSMTWMAEFLTETIETEDRWFLARHTAQTARNGYSSQQMLMWNKAGAPVMIGRQTIALFV